jgi:hypothetical protein
MPGDDAHVGRPPGSQLLLIFSPFSLLRQKEAQARIADVVFVDYRQLSRRSEVWHG